MDEFVEEERRRLTEIVLAKRVPCLVCDDPNIAGAATWIPDKKHRLAVGKQSADYPIFAFALCARHSEMTEANEKKVIQCVLRDVRLGKKWNI